MSEAARPSVAPGGGNGDDRWTSGRLAGQRVLVVGAGSQPTTEPDAPVGNGRAIAVLAARQGATVVCADRDEQAVQETADRIDREGNQAAELVLGDVTREEDCEAIVAAATTGPRSELALD